MILGVVMNRDAFANHIQPDRRFQEDIGVKSPDLVVIPAGSGFVPSLEAVCAAGIRIVGRTSEPCAKDTVQLKPPVGGTIKNCDSGILVNNAAGTTLAEYRFLPRSGEIPFTLTLK